MSIEQLNIGEQVRMGGAPKSWWWDIRATDERFTVLTHAAPKETGKVTAYTIIDRERGVRGPCDLIGQGWDVDVEGGCESLLRALNYHLEVRARLDAGEESVPVEETSVEVSYRNNVPIEIIDRRTPSNTNSRREAMKRDPGWWDMTMEIAGHKRLDPMTANDRCTCGHKLELGKMFTEHIAQRLINQGWTRP